MPHPPSLPPCLPADDDQYLAAFHDLWPSIQDWFDIEGIRQMFFAVSCQVEGSELELAGS